MKITVLTVKQLIRVSSNGFWKARASEHQSRSSRAAFWKPVGLLRCWKENDVKMIYKGRIKWSGQGGNKERKINIVKTS